MIHDTPQTLKEQLKIDTISVLLPCPADDPYFAIRSVRGWIATSNYIGQGRWVGRVFFITDDDPFRKPYETRCSFTTPERALRAAGRSMVVLIANRRREHAARAGGAL